MKKDIIIKLSITINVLLAIVLMFFIFSYLENNGQAADESNTSYNEAIATVCDVVVQDQQMTNIDVYTGETAPVNFESNLDAGLFRTTISNQVAEGANFAGHYTVATWGCGTSCTGYAIVDVITGSIIDYVPYYENQALEGFSSSIDSNILTFNPRPENIETKTAREILNEDGQAHYARVYYDLLESTDDTVPSLRKLCTENVYSGLVR